MTVQFSDRIDVHFHYLSPEYREKMIDAVGAWSDGFPAPHWSAEGALAMMDKSGIATGMLSVSSPGVHFGNDANARILARSVNEFAARTRRPGLFEVRIPKFCTPGNVVRTNFIE